MVNVKNKVASEPPSGVSTVPESEQFPSTTFSLSVGDSPWPTSRNVHCPAKQVWFPGVTPRTLSDPRDTLVPVWNRQSCQSPGAAGVPRSNMVPLVSASGRRHTTGSSVGAITADPVWSSPRKRIGDAVELNRILNALVVASVISCPSSDVNTAVAVAFSVMSASDEFWPGVRSVADRPDSTTICPTVNPCSTAENSVFAPESVENAAEITTAAVSFPSSLVLVACQSWALAGSQSAAPTARQAAAGRPGGKATVHGVPAAQVRGGASRVARTRAWEASG
mmetsp:Transcript_97889/g.261214  ORF Transcript_97889/g.261214 Transcript_97889/m.261214 type:complete len:280 (-) Transcript_97889:555-1394(-)